MRYGLFYGPGTHHDPDTGGVARQVREQKYPVIGSGTGVYSFIHVEDAAAATVAAPPPPHLSEEQAQALGADAIYYATRLRGHENDLAKRKVGFSPRRLEWLSKGTMEFGAGPILAG